MELSIILFALVMLAGMAGVGTRGRKVIKNRRAAQELVDQEIGKDIKKGIEEIRKI